LHDRLSGIRLVIPPLRDRTEDIPLLVESFLESFLRTHGRRHEVAKQLSPDAMAALVAHRWPGNVRELKSRVERAVVKTRRAVVGPRDLQFPRRPVTSAGLRPTAASESLPRTSRAAIDQSP
jgi:DNA-binding NtrC family response regulator